MAIEIERKYLVKKQEWQLYKEKLRRELGIVGVNYCQGYLPTKNETTVRIRIVGDRGYLTIKSKATGYTRSEFEYPIPVEDARQMLETLCLEPVIIKARYKLEYADLVWEVDEFFGENAGLIIAEVELEKEDSSVSIPDWIDREVNDPKYFNSNLIKYPYSQWRDRE